MDPKYEITGEVRPQLKFLEELEKLEKKRKEETERENLLRIAKVSSIMLVINHVEFTLL